VNQVQFAKNSAKKTFSREEALEAVKFEVVREPMLVNYNGSPMKTEREAIIRLGEKENSILGYVSPEYNLISHTDALTAAFEAMDQMGSEYVLQNLQLDRNGAKLYAQFKFLREFEITKGDTLQPVLTLVNGLDGYNALGFDLESNRLVCLNLARSIMKDISQRFMQLENG